MLLVSWQLGDGSSARIRNPRQIGGLYQTSTSRFDIRRRTIRENRSSKRVLVHKVSTSRYICRRCGTRNINHRARHACCFVHPRQLRHKFNSNRLDSRTMGRLAPRDSPGVHTRLPRDHGTPAMERRPPNMATVRPTVAVFL